jgi:threonyl-tRNA synthetase
VHNSHSNDVKMEPWDMMRPLYADCKIQFHLFDEPEGKQAFWHSSAHMLGQAIENTYGAHLCIGPPLQNGFYYDAYVGDEKITPTDYDKINKEIINITK